jgi:hypothetical protein
MIDWLNYNKKKPTKKTGRGTEVSQLLQFPAVKRTGTIRRWASTIAGYHKGKSRENTIRLRLETFAEGLRRIGFGEDMVTQETASLETALRVEVSRLLQYAPGRSA